MPGKSLLNFYALAQIEGEKIICLHHHHIRLECGHDRAYSRQGAELVSSFSVRTYG